jgi:hypothetical protein
MGTDIHHKYHFQKMNGKITVLIVCLIIFINGNMTIHAQFDEYMMKAGFIERFTRFIDWPSETTMADSTKPFIISVIGKNPFDEKLDQFFHTTKIKNRQVHIRYISELDEIQDSHVLFIAQSEQKQLSDIISQVQEKPILTISDTNGFGEKGVLINFFIEQDKIRFEINKNAVQKSGLQVSYLLLNVAKII